MSTTRDRVIGLGRAPVVRTVGAGALAGGLVALSIPPFGFWPLGWGGLAVLAAALAGRAWRSRLVLGAAFGAVDFAIGLLWVQEFSVPGYVALVVVSAAYAVAAVALVPAARRVGVAVGLPATMVLSDWARDRFPLGGFPLGGLSLGQAAGPMAPVLRLGGSLALTGVTAVAGVALAELGRAALVGYRNRRAGPGTDRAPAGAGGRRPTRPALAAGGVAVAVAVLAPLAGLASASGAGGHLAPLRVGLVQGGGPRGTRAVDTDPQVVFGRHLAASALLHGPLDLIVWPEGILQTHYAYTATVDAAALAGLAVAHHATVVAGVDQDVGARHYLNEVVAWAPDGRPVASYVKNHLVPFGEYVPYRSVIQRFFNIADVPRDGIPGHGPGILRTPAAPLAVMISYEVFFDERARGGVRAGGQLLVVPTNTASYRSTQVPTQEVAADRMRAWETGRWLVQVTPTGYSDVVTPTGRIVRATHLDARSVVMATVGRRTGMTVYDRIGDAPVAVAALVAWAAVALAGFRRSRRRRDRTSLATPADDAVAVPSA